MSDEREQAGAREGVRVCVYVCARVSEPTKGRHGHGDGGRVEESSVVVTRTYSLMAMPMVRCRHTTER